MNGFVWIIYIYIYIYKPIVRQSTLAPFVRFFFFFFFFFPALDSTKANKRKKKKKEIEMLQMNFRIFFGNPPHPPVSGCLFVRVAFRMTIVGTHTHKTTKRLGFYLNKQISFAHKVNKK